jgi:multiple sugar transport system substrate-binding protein
MRKILFLVLVVITVLCAPVFAGAGRQAGTAPAGGGGQVTLKWPVWDYSTTPYYNAFIDAYRAKNPNVRFEPIDLGSADFHTVLLTQLAGGADLDLITVKDIAGYSNLLRQNRMESLNAYIRSANIDTKLYGGIVEQLTFNGEVYALPFRSDFYIVYYNKALFDAAGVPYPTNDMTLDQYDALARRVTQGAGATKTYGAHYHTWPFMVWHFGLMDGTTIVNGNYNFLAPHYERVLKQQDDGIVMPYATLRTSGTHYSGAFYNSQIAMMHMGSWFIASQIDAIKRGEASSTNWGIVKYPHPAGIPAGTTLGSVTGIGVNRNARNKDAAMDFVKFISGPEGAAIIAKTGNFPAIMSPEVINTITSTPGFPTDANSREALNVYRNIFERPVHERMGEIETALGEIHADIMAKNISVANGIRLMNERVARILGR